MLGRPIVRFDRVSSTMDVLSVLAAVGAPEGTTVVTGFQESGRGRAGRRWEVPPDQALLASVLLRPDLPLPRLMPLSILVADAIRGAVSSLCGVDASIKWPNDVLIAGRKLSGVLIQTRWLQERSERTGRQNIVVPSEVERSRECVLRDPSTPLGGFATSRARDDDRLKMRPGQSATERSLSVIVGFGINANVPRTDLPPTGTSLLAETGRAVDRDVLLRGVLEALEIRYQEMLGDRLAARWETIQSDLAMRGEQVRVEDAGRTATGILVGVDPDGALVLRGEGGNRRIVAGDLSRGPRPLST